MWQREGGWGGGGQMPSLNFESSYMYGPAVDLTFHLIEYDSYTVSLLLVSSYRFYKTTIKQPKLVNDM